VTRVPFALFSPRSKSFLEPHRIERKKFWLLRHWDVHCPHVTRGMCSMLGSLLQRLHG
jgi:hypothetical protein